MASWDQWAPYTDRGPRPHRLTAANALIFLNLAGFLAAGFFPDALRVLEFDAREAIGALRVWQFATYPFVQEIDVLFIVWFILGAYTLYTLGNDLEAEIGPGRFVLFYLSFSAYGAVAHALVQYVGPYTDALRASTLLAPVAGIAAAAAVRTPLRPTLFFLVLPLRRITAVALAFLAGIGYALLAFPAVLAAAIGAALAGAAVVMLEPRIDGHLERRSLRRERDQFLQDIEIRRETEHLLDKISREGIESLTRAELKTLKGASALLKRERRDRHE